MTHHTYVINHQPRRDPEGKFRFRTYPYIHKDRKTIYDPQTPTVIVSQLIVYRWSRSLDFVRAVPTGNLYDFLFHDVTAPKSKIFMGSTIIQAPDYNCRIIDRTNDGAVRCYFFENREDLTYGLEWMICSWLVRLFALQSEEATDDLLEEIATCDENFLQEKFLSPALLKVPFMEQIDWVRIGETHNIDFTKNVRLADPFRNEPRVW